MTIFAPSSYHELGVMLHDALELSPTGPAVIRWPEDDAARRRRRPTDEVGSGLSARKVRAGPRRLPPRRGQDARRRPGPPPRRWPAEGVEATVWDARLVKPLDPEMLADAAAPPRAWSPSRTATATAASASAIADRSAGLAAGRGGTVPRVRVLGVPVRYIPHGKPDAILAASASMPRASPPRCVRFWPERRSRRKTRQGPDRKTGPGLSPWSPPAVIGVHHS